MATWADIQRGIFAGESGGDYGALYGYANRPDGLFSDVNLQDMTVAEVMDFTSPSGPYGQYVASMNEGTVATPVGAYQVVGTTLRDAAKGLGLTGSERFDKATQDRIGQWIYNTQGTGAWEGYQGPQSGGQDMPQDTPQGILGMVGGNRPQQDQGRFWGSDRQRDLAGRIAMAANTLRQRPDQNITAAVMGAREQRAGNRTAEWLAQQPGGEAYAQMISAGVSPAQVVAQYRADQQGAGPTAAMQNYKFLLSQGVQPDDAVGRAFSGGVNVNMPGAPTIGAIPPGYQAVQDPTTGAYRMELIPGGPAAQEAEQEAAAAEERAAAAASQGGTKSATIASSVDFLVDKIDKGGMFNLPESGIYGNVLGTLGINQEAVDFRNELSTIQANTAFDRLQQMRDASKTGGALGAVSERELDLLMSAYGNLAQSTSPDRLKANLLTIKRIMTKIENDPIASAMYYDNSGAPIPQGGGFSVTGRSD